MSLEVGFMQGRLSNLVDGKIQAFPEDEWENEFNIANDIGINLMEWTLDYKNLYQNPLLNVDGQKKIMELSIKNSLAIKSLTGDCFMQRPFWKSTEIEEKNSLEKDFVNILLACNKIGIKIVVIPLVDNGSIENIKQMEDLISFLNSKISFLQDLDISIAFESDMPPKELQFFMNKFPSNIFGVNYDTGNSAALGFDPEIEFKLIGEKIINIHIKDRIFKSHTVPLGDGNVNFEKIFKLIAKYNYKGNLILQTARDINQEHDKLICKYRNLILDYIKLNID